MNKYIYLCGPTVYNKVHIGNMRPIVTFDLILRGLKFLDQNIKLIHNITDIDDKIIAQAIKENIDEKQISEKYYIFYLDMLKQFNIKTIDIMPKVTDHINDIEKFVSQLIKNGYAYELNGSIYFNTSKLSNYGSVSNIKLDKLLNTNDLEQKNSFDFALWKNKTKGKTWNTTLGIGRPGWHTECAVFVDKYTNHQSLLLHGGGIDLKFPHHENENAQYIAANNKDITQNWLHIGVINWQNQKMSKSIGNIIYADEFINHYQNKTNSVDLFRLLIISSSYNSIIELNNELIDSMIKKMIQIEKAINYLLVNEINIKEDHELNTYLSKELSTYSFSSIYKELNSNIKKYNETKESEYAKNIFNMIKFLGFTCVDNVIDNKIKSIYHQWKNEIKNKNYDDADKLRKILIENKII